MRGSLYKIAPLSLALSFTSARAQFGGPPPGFQGPQSSPASASDFPKSPSSAPAASSGSSSAFLQGASPKRSKRRDPAVTVNASGRMSRQASDYREIQQESAPRDLQLGAQPIVVPDNEKSEPGIVKSSSPMSLNQYKFDARLSFFSDGRNFAGLNAALPFRTLSTADSRFSSGSEFGGFEGGLDVGSRGIATLRALFAQRQSPRLQLLSPHQEVFVSLMAENGGLLRGGSDLLIQAGPEYVYKLNSSTQVLYAPQFGGAALLSYEFALTAENIFRFETSARFRRTNSYKVAGRERGAAAVGVVIPSLEYQFRYGMWLGAHYEYSFLQPKGREAHFGNPNLAGLFGTSLGFHVRADTF